MITKFMIKWKKLISFIPCFQFLIMVCFIWIVYNYNSICILLESWPTGRKSTKGKKITVKELFIYFYIIFLLAKFWFYQVFQATVLQYLQKHKWLGNSLFSQHILYTYFIEFATVTQHGYRGWKRTSVQFDINPFITHPAHERLYHSTGLSYFKTLGVGPAGVWTSDFLLGKPALIPLS